MALAPVMLSKLTPRKGITKENMKWCGDVRLERQGILKSYQHESMPSQRILERKFVEKALDTIDHNETKKNGDTITNPLY